MDAAREANSNLDPDEVTVDLDAAADYAEKLPAANGKLAVVGFCWGGGQSFRFATHRPDLSAAYVFYGQAPENAGEAKAPVYGFYAENDARITSTLPDTTKTMKVAKRVFEPVVYKEAGHGFMRAGQDPAGTVANKKAREDAWKRWIALLQRL